MKLMLCEKCMVLTVPDNRANLATWCACRRHACWWEDPRAGKFVVFDGEDGVPKPGSEYDGFPRKGPYVYVIGLHNHVILFDLNTPEKVAAALADTPESYLFKKCNSLVVKFRPLETGDTRWSGRLPGR